MRPPRINRPPPPSLAALARQYGVGRETIRRWRDQGIDITDQKVMKAQVAGMAKGGSSPDLAAARLEKIQAETARIKFAHEVEAGRFVCAATVKAEGAKIGQTIRAALSELTQSLPPQLGGRDATECHAILKREFRRILQQLKDNPTSPIQSPEK